MLTQRDATQRALTHMRATGRGHLQIKAVRRIWAASMPPRLRRKLGDAWVIAFALPEVEGCRSVPNEVSIMVLDATGEVIAGPAL